MKVRNGFVSNSSSSSFVVAFPTKPKSSKELQAMLFKDIPYVLVEAYPKNYRLGTKTVADIIFDHLKTQRSMGVNQIAEELRSGYRGSNPNYEDFVTEPNAEWDIKVNAIDWEKWEQACVEISKEDATKFKQDNPDAKIYVFEYGNDGGGDKRLEYAEVFTMLHHMTVNKH